MCRKDGKVNTSVGSELSAELGAVHPDAYCTLLNMPCGDLSGALMLCDRYRAALESILWQIKDCNGILFKVVQAVAKEALDSA